MGSNELEKLLAKLAKARRKSKPQTPSPVPGCAFGYVVDRRLQDMEANIKELKSRINGLIFVVMGAVTVEVVMRLVT